MGNIVDELIGGDTSEVDGLWVTVQDQSKEIKQLRDFISGLGLDGSLPDSLKRRDRE